MEGVEEWGNLNFIAIDGDWAFVVVNDVFGPEDSVAMLVCQLVGAFVGELQFLVITVYLPRHVDVANVTFLRRSDL